MSGGEFGESESTVQASIAKFEFNQKVMNFLTLLQSGDIQNARIFAEEQATSGSKIYLILLNDAEEAAKKQIDRP